MKTLLFFLFLFSSITNAAEPTTISFIWDSNPDEQMVTKYRLYADGVVISEVVADENANEQQINNFTAPAITTDYYVTAVNSGGESEPSNTVSFSPPPEAPFNLKITITKENAD